MPLEAYLIRKLQYKDLNFSERKKLSCQTYFYHGPSFPREPWPLWPKMAIMANLTIAIVKHDNAMIGIPQKTLKNYLSCEEIISIRVIDKKLLLILQISPKKSP